MAKNDPPDTTGDPTRAEPAATVSHPHDAFFKKTFSDPRQAAGELQAVLPRELAARLDWASLTLQPGSFVDKSLQWRHTDLLFRVSMLDGHEGFLFVLFEHQSTSDNLAPYRILAYMVRIWDRWLREHENSKTLPVVIPVVLYHGEKPWAAPTELAQLFDLQDDMRAALGPLIPQLGFVLDDLTAQDDEQLQQRAMDAMGRLALLLFKHARHSVDLLQRFADWTDVLSQVLAGPNGREAFLTALRYTMSVRDDLQPGQLLQVIKRAQLGAKAEDALMTLEQRLIEKGRQSLLRRMLTKRFGPPPPWAMERIDNAAVDQVDIWSDRLLDVKSLDDVLGGPS